MLLVKNHSHPYLIDNNQNIDSNKVGGGSVPFDFSYIDVVLDIPSGVKLEDLYVLVLNSYRREIFTSSPLEEE